MPNPNDLTQKALQALRRQGSVLTSAELQASLGVGQPVPFARMVPLEGCAFWVDEADGARALHGGLPWFLDGMRPQGFHGPQLCPRPPRAAIGQRPAGV